jgi:hypothetical protein
MTTKRKLPKGMYKATWGAKMSADTVEDAVRIAICLVAQEGMRLAIQTADTDGRYGEADTVDISAADLIAGLQNPPPNDPKTTCVQLRRHVDRFMTDAGQVVLRDLLVKW